MPTTASDARATSPSLAGDVVAPSDPMENAPDADAHSEHGSDHVGDEQNLGDLGGEADDGDDSDPYKFIEKSMHYQDMLMSKRHCEERVNFFTEFAKSMPKGKDPFSGSKGGKMGQYKSRIERVDKRITTFRDKYAANRAVSKEARAKRIEAARKTKEEEDQLGKPLRTALNKEKKAAEVAAQKAATAAIAALGDGATEEAQMEAGLKAMKDAMLASFEASFKKTPATTEGTTQPATTEQEAVA